MSGHTLLLAVVALAVLLVYGRSIVLAIDRALDRLEAARWRESVRKARENNVREFKGRG